MLLSSHRKRWRLRIMIFGRMVQPGQRLEYYPVCATRGSLPCIGNLLVPLTGNKGGGARSFWEFELGLHQLGSQQTFFYIPVDIEPLDSISSE